MSSADPAALFDLHGQVALVTGGAGGLGVRVNAIAPCSFDTPMVRRILEAEPAYRERVAGKIPLGRMGEPREIVGAALYLASAASAMVTGTILSVDGGYVAQ